MKLNLKLNAFTLAEVLITLGIIGVVAAMTIPTLIQKHEERVTVVKLKKMHSTLAQAYLMNKAHDGVTLGVSQIDNDSAAKEIADVFVPYLKIHKDCKNTEKGCMFSGTYKHKNGNAHAKYDVGGAGAYRVLLADGASIWFRRTKSTNNTTGAITYYDTIYYDLNGPKDPNIWGKDLFYFQILNDTIVAVGDENTLNPFSTYCKASDSTGQGCAAWVIKNGNMDYLHCNYLSWDGKHKCD